MDINIPNDIENILNPFKVKSGFHKDAILVLVDIKFKLNEIWYKEPIDDYLILECGNRFNEYVLSGLQG
jgi:hypothetical protein